VTRTIGSLPFDLRAAIEHLSAADPLLAKVIEGAEGFRLRSDEGESPYEVLLSAITYQSISGKAAETIFGRIKALGSGGRAPTPHEMIRLRKSVLRKAGLSGAKVVAMKDLARKTIDGVVPSHDEALTISDEELVARLTAVRGIGTWTVEMFLIFRLGRPDVLPIDDLAVKKGWSVTYGKKHMPKPKELLAFGERWRPYRTVASWYMWRAFERAGHSVTRAIRAKKPSKKRAAKQAAISAGKQNGNKSTRK
jgi:3-methyladenine DNA glycosylase/8-oxoguanine DNA glycosylase